MVRSHFPSTQPITEGRSLVDHLLMYISTIKHPRLMGETWVLIHFLVAKHGTANIACLVTHLLKRFFVYKLKIMDAIEAV